MIYYLHHNFADVKSALSIGAVPSHSPGISKLDRLFAVIYDEMTKEEKELIRECRIWIDSTVDFKDYLEDELIRIGFVRIQGFQSYGNIHDEETPDLIIAGPGNDYCNSSGFTTIPIIFTFDFIMGAGAIVLLHGDDRKWLGNINVRLWAAQYMSGYCAFWNIKGCEWLHDELPLIKDGLTGGKRTLKTSAFLCARIAANIAAGRHVKHFPRFFLCRNS